jgi:hypothetical protein
MRFLLSDQIFVLRDHDVLHVMLKDENWSQTWDFDTNEAAHNI